MQSGAWYTVVPPALLSLYQTYAAAGPLIGEADNRGFGYSGMASKQYRVLQKITVRQAGDGSFSVVPNTAKVSLQPSLSYRAINWNSEKGALANGVKGRIDTADQDPIDQANQCNLLHGKSTSASIVPKPALTLAPFGQANVDFGGKALDGLVKWLVPAIDWGFVVNINAAKKTVRINGAHDSFPAYEVYVNKQLIYSFNPLGKPLPQVVIQPATVLVGLNNLRPVDATVPLK